MLRALAKEPERRYVTCRAFVEELRQAVRPRAAARVTAPVAPPPAPVSPAPPPPPAAPAPLPPQILNATPPPPPVAGAAAAVVAPVETGKRKSVLRLAAAAILVALAALLIMTWERRNAPKPVAHAPAPITAPAVATVVKTAPPAPVKKAAAVNPKPAAETPVPVPRGGTFEWTGVLTGGDSVTITGNEADNGKVSGRGLPRHAAAMVEVDPPDVKVSEEPSADNGYKLLLINEGREVTSFTVSWKPGKRKEGE